MLRLLRVLGPWVRLGSSPLFCGLGPEPTYRCLLAVP